MDFAIRVWFAATEEEVARTIGRLRVTLIPPSKSSSFIGVYLRQPKRQDVRTCRHCHILFAFRQVSHGRRFPRLVRMKVPERLARFSLHCGKGSAVVTKENQSSGG